MVFVITLISVFLGMIQADEQKITITADKAAVRAEPDIESPMIKLVSRGEVLESVDRINEWHKVSVFLEDKEIDAWGYIHSSLVTVLEDLSIKTKDTKEEALQENKVSASRHDMDLKIAKKRTWLGFKLKGGASYILAGDINEGTEDFNRLWRNEFSYPGAGIEGKLTSFHIVYDFEGDLIFYIFPNIGIGFGSGYMMGNQRNEMLLTLPTGEGPWVIRPELKVIPIKAGLYFLIPLGGGSYFTLDAGAGWYSVDYNWSWKGEDGSGYWAEINQEASAQDIGYHAGLGFEIGLGPHFALLLEGRARYAEISGFEGTLEYKDSFGGSDLDQGKLYYWREPVFSKKYTFVFIHESETPSFTGLSPAEFVREAVVDLTGFSLQAGLKIKF